MDTVYKIKIPYTFRYCFIVDNSLQDIYYTNTGKTLLYIILDAAIQISRITEMFNTPNDLEYRDILNPYSSIIKQLYEYNTLELLERYYSNIEYILELLFRSARELAISLQLEALPDRFLIVDYDDMYIIIAENPDLWRT